MSKKYKLIKDLPDMNAGKMFEWSTDSNAYVAQKDIWIGNNQWATYSKGTVEQSKEFWEEIKEPEFQILAAKTSVKVSLTAENTSTEIYKVIRLSDNTVFSVGDKLKYISIKEKVFKTIKSFSLKDNSEILVYFNEDGNYTAGFKLDLLNSYKHYKSPLFTTEDKIDVFKGDLYFYVDDYFDIVGVRAGITSGTNGFKYFSTEKAAKDWVELNKPRYSLQDIKNACLNNTKDCEYATLSFLRLYK